MAEQEKRTLHDIAAAYGDMEAAAAPGCGPADGSPPRPC
jgi:hypothetical protein